MLEVKALDFGDDQKLSAALYVNELKVYTLFMHPKKEAVPFLQRKIDQIRQQIHFSHEIDLTVIKSIGEMIAKLQEPVN